MTEHSGKCGFRRGGFVGSVRRQSCANKVRGLRSRAIHRTLVPCLWGKSCAQDILCPGIRVELTCGCMRYYLSQGQRQITLSGVGGLRICLVVLRRCPCDAVHILHSESQMNCSVVISDSSGCWGLAFCLVGTIIPQRVTKFTCYSLGATWLLVRWWPMSAHDLRVGVGHSCWHK